jgi:hypothetical protein
MNLRLRTNRNADRRQNLRKAPEKFAFIQLEHDDGGAVLNISEGGLSFSTFAAVEQKGPIHFWFSLNLNERIDAWGELAWTDGTKKVGGLRFIRLPKRAERQIREWISGAVSPQVADGRLGAPEGPGQPSGVKANQPDAVARFVSKSRAERSLIQANSILSSGEDSSASAAPLARLEEAEARGELVPMQRYISEKRRQFSRGLLLGVCISVTIGAPAMKYWSYRHESRDIRKSPAELGAQKSSGDDWLQGSLKTSSENSNSANFSPNGNPKKDAAVARRPSILASETGGHPVASAAEAPASNPSSRAPLPSSLNGNSGRQRAALTPQQLWASVQAGNAKAAVALAELYIKGEGVPQNCNQARVLLLVASEKRNAEAIKRLQELDKTDCPSN